MPPSSKNNDNKSSPVYIILGSGGHTAEMCNITRSLFQSESTQHGQLYMPTKYLIASSDSTSRLKICLSMRETNHYIPEDAYLEIPRSREVGQSWWTTIFTTMWALLSSFWLIYRDKPRLILCNGPGTCVPFCVAAYFWRLVGRLPTNTRIVFMESFCRVRTLSLSGRLLMPFVDALIVQWPSLAHKYRKKPQVKYFGQLM